MRGMHTADFMRMPPGDRGPRLRFLAQHHREAMAVLDPNDPKAQRHARAVMKIERVARLVVPRKY